MLKLLKEKASFPVVIFAILLAGFVFACLGTVRVNRYENRTAEKLCFPTMASYRDQSFQSNTESGLGDQLPFAISIKKAFNDCKSDLLNICIKASYDLFGQNREANLHDADTDSQTEFLANMNIPFIGNVNNLEINCAVNFKDKRYYSIYDNVFSFNGHLLISPQPIPANPEETGIIPSINDAISNIESQNIYVAYIERECDIDFSTNRKTGLFDTLKQNLNLEADHISCFEINSFDTFDQLFYKTDHHWNHKGSYLGYRMIMNMLKPQDICLEPVSEQLLGTGHGSRAIGSAQQTTEPIMIYNYIFPEYNIKQNGEITDDYGEASFLAETVNEDSYHTDLIYQNIYGNDIGQIIIKKAAPEKNAKQGKILILGDSFDNALLKLIAAHYNETHNVDLRYYQKDGEKFSLSKYVDQYDIDTILFVGRNDFYFGEEFIFDY